MVYCIFFITLQTKFNKNTTFIMKKFTFIIILILLFGSLSMAQTRWQKKRIPQLENKLENAKDGIEQLKIYDELAEIHLGFNPSKSIEYLEKTKKLIRKNNPSLILEANIYNSYGAAYFYLKDYKKSAKSYEEELKILKKSGDIKKIAESEYNIATIYLANGNKNKAKNHYEKSLAYAKQINNEDIMSLNYSALYSIYDDSGILHNDSKALENLKLFIELRNAQITKDSRTISILRRKYKVERNKRIDTEKELEVANSTLQAADSTLHAIDSILTLVELHNELLEQEAIMTEIEMNLIGAQEELNIEKIKLQENEAKYEVARKKQMIQLIIAVSIIGLFMLISSIWLFGLYKKIRRKNKKLQEQKEEISTQRDDIETKNIHITDSINYAQKIQESILIPEKEIREHLPNMFVLFRPRDIVSGDFYWFSKVDNKSIIAAIDCTGHGVPGAFLSMIGNTLLNEIVNEKNVTKPDKILTLLHFGVLTALQQNKTETEAEDGMDMSLCTIDDSQQRFQFAGAKNHLYVVQGDALKILRANHHSIGGKPLRPGYEVEFTSYDFMYDKNTSIYMLSDGYLDQFGGVENKKFNTKRFKSLLLDNRNVLMPEQKTIFNETMDNWIGSEQQIDDMLVVGIKFMTN